MFGMARRVPEVPQASQETAAMYEAIGFKKDLTVGTMRKAGKYITANFYDSLPIIAILRKLDFPDNGPQEALFSQGNICRGRGRRF